MTNSCVRVSGFKDPFYYLKINLALKSLLNRSTVAQMAELVVKQHQKVPSLNPADETLLKNIWSIELVYNVHLLYHTHYDNLFITRQKSYLSIGDGSVIAPLDVLDIVKNAKK